MQEADKKMLMSKKAEILKIRKDEEARKKELLAKYQEEIGKQEKKSLEAAELILTAASKKTTGRCEDDGPEIVEKKSLKRIPVRYEANKMKIPIELTEMKEDLVWYLALRSEIKVTTNCLLTIAKTETFVEALKKWEVEKKTVGDGNLFRIGQDLRAISELIKKGMTWNTCHSMLKLQRRLFEQLELEKTEPIKEQITATEGKNSREISRIIKFNNDQRARQVALNLAKSFDEATVEVTGKRLDLGWFWESNLQEEDKRIFDRGSELFRRAGTERERSDPSFGRRRFEVWIHTKMLPTVVDENSERIKKLIAKFKNAPEEPMIVEERVVREVEEEVAGPSRIVIAVSYTHLTLPTKA